MARNYTKEAGVRQLERKIGDICRKTAREILETKKKSVRVTERNIAHYLGKELYIYQMARYMDQRRRRYAADRGQYYAGRGRGASDRTDG